MGLQIVIEDATVHVKQGISKRTNKEYSIREQRCWVHGVARFPLETRINVPDDMKDGYAVGTYDVTKPLTVGRFGLEVPRDLGLVLAKAAARAA